MMAPESLGTTKPAGAVVLVRDGWLMGRLLIKQYIEIIAYPRFVIVDGHRRRPWCRPQGPLSCSAIVR
jgi:hypothetical protein